MADATDVKATQHLSFTIAREEYAVPILRVKELVQYMPVTRMPSTPKAVRGVINLRGRVVPVVDLALRFGREETLVTRWTCIVMLEVTNEGVSEVVGVLADTVNEVLDLAAADVEPPPSFGTTASAAYLTGMGKYGKRLVLLLDVDRALAAAIHQDAEPTPVPADASATAEAPPGEAADAAEAPVAEAQAAPEQAGP